MVVIGMRDDERIEGKDPCRRKATQERGIIPAGIDKNRMSTALEEYRVALTHIEHAQGFSLEGGKQHCDAEKGKRHRCDDSREKATGIRPKEPHQRRDSER